MPKFDIHCISSNDIASFVQRLNILDLGYELSVVNTNGFIESFNRKNRKCIRFNCLLDV
jgi:hypothetical protein